MDPSCFEAWEDFDYDVQSIVPVGERHVVAAVRIRGRGARSGIEVEDVAGWVIEVRDRQAIYVEVKLSVDRAFEVARRREGIEK
jgi:ketosteroid isomerase-like protein